MRGRIGRPAAAKTGTTQDHGDAWFVDFTPSLAAAVWVGYPQGQVPMVPPRTRGRVSGGTWPASIWARFMRPALAATPHGRFPRPDTSLVSEVLGQPEAAARQLLSGAGSDAEVLAGCDADPARAAEPGRVWRSGPAPGAQAPTGTRVRLWANPPGCPPLTTITTRPGPSTTSRAER